MAVSVGGEALLAVAGAQPSSACGLLACDGAAGAGWWWNAAELTAYARVDGCATHAGVRLTFTFDRTLQDELLHSEGWAAALPTLSVRARDLKRAVDREAYRGARPSRALNKLVETADRMQLHPNRTALELAGYAQALQEVVRLHTRDDGSAATAAGLPSLELQRVIRAALGPPDK